MIKSKDNKYNFTSRLKNLNVDEDKKIAYISGWASKAYDEDGNQVVDRDGETVKVSNFRIDKARTLLRDHDMSYPVGKMLLTHKPQGLWIDAEVHEVMCEKTFYAVKEGILDSFSIGMLVEEADYVSVKGQDVLQLSSGEIYETSILSVASNADATVQSVKSIIGKDGVCKGFQLQDKEQNKETEEVTIKKFDIQKFKEDFKKGLTIQETSEERWNIGDDFWQMFSYFRQTIEDNFDTLIWNEEFTKDEMLTNLEQAFETFKETANEVATAVETKREKSLETTSETEAKTKTVETESKESTEAPKEETPSETQTEVKEETPKEVTETEVKTENIETEVQATEVKDNESENKPEVSEDKVETETPKEVEETKPTETKEEVQEVSFAKPTLNDTLALLNEAKLDELPAEDIERIYNDSGALMEKIEEMVKADLSA